MYSRSGSYTTDKPPYCVMILRAVSDSTPPPDLTVSLTLTGGMLLEPITLERKGEHPSLQLSPLPPPLQPGSNPPQAAMNQGSQSHEEEKTSMSDKGESQKTDKQKSSYSAEPSQDNGAGSMHAKLERGECKHRIQAGIN